MVVASSCSFGDGDILIEKGEPESRGGCGRNGKVNKFSLCLLFLIIINTSRPQLITCSPSYSLYNDSPFDDEPTSKPLGLINRGPAQCAHIHTSKRHP